MKKPCMDCHDLVSVASRFKGAVGSQAEDEVQYLARKAARRVGRRGAAAGRLRELRRVRADHRADLLHVFGQAGDLRDERCAQLARVRAAGGGGGGGGGAALLGSAWRNQNSCFSIKQPRPDVLITVHPQCRLLHKGKAHESEQVR